VAARQDPRMESRTGSRRRVRSEDLLPPPPTGKALLFGGVAALIGAGVWALLLVFTNSENSLVAWGIGGLIGFAIIKAGGHGQLLAISAAVLAVLAIGTGKHLSYTHQVDSIIDMSIADLTPELHEGIGEDVKAWAALGDAPTDEQIETFALDRGYEVDSVEEFRELSLPMIEWYRDNQPSLEQWRSHQRDVIASSLANEFSFVDYLKADLHIFDVLFLILGLGTAFYLVSNHTSDLKSAAHDQLRAERRAAEEAEHEDGGAVDGETDEREANR